jgi:sialate O-acetylesterase
VGAACAPGTAARAAVKPHALFSDNMVLQQGMEVPVWGTASPGERVTVTFGGQKASTTAKDGRWMVRLRPLKASSTASRMTIAGENTVNIGNVLVGEVWIASGQSNMQWPVRASADPDRVIAAATDTQIRLITVPRRATDAPQADVQASWVECSPQTVPDFSAVAYHFGRTLRAKLGVPVGLISTNYGGTLAEAWTRRGVLESGFPQTLERQAQAEGDYLRQKVQYELALSRARAAGTPQNQLPRAPQDPAQSVNRPSGLYNAMIAPLIPYAIRGAIWYQGESNAGRAWEYRTLFPAMIRNWREDWGQGDFPFLFVQLAPFMKIVSEPGESNWAELREAQLHTAQTVKNTGMAVITDVGEENDIHPKAKEPVGYRLALHALAMTYDQDLVHSGPELSRLRTDGDRAVLSFKSVGQGLEARGGELKGFAVAGPDRKWVNAQARIEGNTVVVTAPGVSNPVAVRYGWANYPLGNLWNKDGLPATPFRTDDWPVTTQPK